jgi:hypothetical protein
MGMESPPSRVLTDSLVSRNPPCTGQRLDVKSGDKSPFFTRFEAENFAGLAATSLRFEALSSIA